MRGGFSRLPLTSDTGYLLLAVPALLQPVTLGRSINWKILKEMGIPDYLTCLLRNLLQVKKQQLEVDMEQQTGSK